jgi:acetyl-CoA carboxylase biotin carboxyl carrier protein
VIRTLELVVHRDDRGWRVASPAPGWFHPAAHERSWLGSGDVLGMLDVLGQTIALTVPAGVAGNIQHVLEPRAVGYGDELAQVDPRAPDAAETSATTKPETATHGLVFRAPTSGRYYGRPSPDKPPFVTVSSELGPGATICLLEVMKTFNRVTYSGARVRVTELLVAEGADVNAGDPLLALEPL